MADKLQPQSLHTYREQTNFEMLLAFIKRLAIKFWAFEVSPPFHFRPATLYLLHWVTEIVNKKKQTPLQNVQPTQAFSTSEWMWRRSAIYVLSFWCHFASSGWKSKCVETYQWSHNLIQQIKL